MNDCVHVLRASILFSFLLGPIILTGSIAEAETGNSNLIIQIIKVRVQVIYSLICSSKKIFFNESVFYTCMHFKYTELLKMCTDIKTHYLKL